MCCLRLCVSVACRSPAAADQGQQLAGVHDLTHRRRLGLAARERVVRKPPPDRHHSFRHSLVGSMPLTLCLVLRLVLCLQGSVPDGLERYGQPRLGARADLDNAYYKNTLRILLSTRAFLPALDAVIPRQLVGAPSRHFRRFAARRARQGLVLSARGRSQRCEDLCEAAFTEALPTTEDARGPPQPGHTPRGRWHTRLWPLELAIGDCVATRPSESARFRHVATSSQTSYPAPSRRSYMYRSRSTTLSSARLLSTTATAAMTAGLNRSHRRTPPPASRRSLL